MKVKVYGVGYLGRTRRIVATTSQKRAAELIGVSLSYLRDYGSVTGNELELSLALPEPEKVFERRGEYHDSRWVKID